ncbi:hypothetical protein EJB05_26268, partial [Eragrostis curvula]
MPLPKWWSGTPWTCQGDAGKDPDRVSLLDVCTALQNATCKGHLEIVELLLQHGVEYVAIGRWAHYQNNEMINMLDNHGSKLKGQGALDEEVGLPGGRYASQTRASQGEQPEIGRPGV